MCVGKQIETILYVIKLWSANVILHNVGSFYVFFPKKFGSVYVGKWILGLRCVGHSLQWHIQNFVEVICVSDQK
jgi:hypothetical protein